MQLCVVDCRIACIGSVFGRWCIQERGFPLAKMVEGPLHFFIFAVTIVVVAVPEGLPLAVTISLAYRCVLCLWVNMDVDDSSPSIDTCCYTT